MLTLLREYHSALLKERGERIGVWSRTALEEVLEFKAPIPQATLEDMEAARALLSELKVRKEVAVVPKYGRHIVSVEWNLHARSVLGGARAAASASLERIKEVLPTCDGFFMHATHLRYGAKQVLERSKVMLAFATDEEAYAARQQLQMQKVKGEGNWEAVEFGRNVANLSRPKGSRPKGSLVFVCPLSGAEGAEWLSSKLGVPWDYVLEEPEFARNKTGGGFTVYTASYGSNWAKIAHHKIVGDRPYREAEAPSCFQCGGVGHMIATCRSHAIRFYLSEPCTLVAKADLKTRLRASKLVCGDRDEHPHDPPAFGTAWFHDLAAFTEAVKKVDHLVKSHDEAVIRAEGHLGGMFPNAAETAAPL